MKRCRHSSIFVIISLIVFIISCTNLRKSTHGEKMASINYDMFTNMSSQDILAQCNTYLEKAHAHKNNLLSIKKSTDSLQALEEYNEILIQLDAASAQASLLSNVHPLEKVRKDAEECEQKVSTFVTNLSLDESVYSILSNLDKSILDKNALRMLEHTLRSFKRSGVDKDEQTRAEIKKLKEELVIIGQKFGQNIREERLFIELNSVKDLEGLPQDYIDSHTPNENGKIVISTDYPDYVPFMQYAKSDTYRQQLRHKSLNRGKNNGSVLQDMIDKRYELARILGYSSYANYIVEDKMIKNAQSIQNFIDKISLLAKKGADQEYLALLDFKRKTHKNAKTIEGYESAYLEEAFKKEHFKFDSQEARAYFPYEQVKNGVLDTTAKLFSIEYRKSDVLAWEESVDVYDVYENNIKIGRIYLDMHPREGKYKHAAQFTIKSGLNNRQYPEGALVCNFPKPTQKDPYALMEHDQVVTFFHEFGHLLHHVFAGKQDWMPFSGVATEWDFVEAPSQFLEEWAWSPEVLSSFAKHYQTSEPISADLVQKMKSANEFGKALSVRQQMFYAALSLNYFDKDPKSFSMQALLEELQAKYSYYPYEKDTYFYKNFGHLEGYSAMYYTYMWSLSIAKDLFEPFKNNSLMDLSIAKRYKDIVLSQGGSKDAQDLIEEFLQRPFSFDAFEKWINFNPLI